MPLCVGEGVVGGLKKPGSSGRWLRGGGAGTCGTAKPLGILGETGALVLGVLGGNVGNPFLRIGLLLETDGAGCNVGCIAMVCCLVEDGGATGNCALSTCIVVNQQAATIHQFD